MVSCECSRKGGYESQTSEDKTVPGGKRMQHHGNDYKDEKNLTMFIISD